MRPGFSVVVLTALYDSLSLVKHIMYPISSMTQATSLKAPNLVDG